MPTVSSSLRPKAEASSGDATRVYRERVLVRVYDLGRTFVTQWHNKMTKSYGAFHTGVEVYGREWSFGMTFDDYSTGVTWNVPAQHPDHAFRETLSMGYTTLSPREVTQILEEMKVEWKGNTYNVLTRNCHSFSDAFCRRLGVAPLPNWVNELADTGRQTSEFFDGADSGYDGGSALVDFFGSLKDKVYAAFVGSPEEEEMERRKLEAASAAARQQLPPPRRSSVGGSPTAAWPERRQLAPRLDRQRSAATSAGGRARDPVVDGGSSPDAGQTWLVRR